MRFAIREGDLEHFYTLYAKRHTSKQNNPNHFTAKGTAVGLDSLLLGV